MTKVTAVESLKDPLHKVASGRVEKPIVTESGAVVGDKPKKAKNKKYAMCLAYQGKNYYGMQIQPHEEMPTIESHLLDAMLKVGMITEEMRKVPSKFSFQRAARTDRRVSAVRQFVSFFLPLTEENQLNGHEILNKELPQDIKVLAIRRTIPSFHCQKRCDCRTYSYTLPTFAFAPVAELTTDSFRLSPERLVEVNEVLKCFVGTHNFFNYTSRREHNDMSSNRYIIDFKCSEPFTFTHDFGFKKTEFEFATIYIKGQSFMLHQIRKMIGMTLTILRGFQNKSDVTRSFESLRLDVPRAPGLGLLLEQVHYHSYDKNYSNVHPTLDSFEPETEEKIKRIREELIMKEILETEVTSNQMMMWLADLIRHDFQIEAEQEASSGPHGLALARATAEEATGEKTKPVEEDEVDETELEDVPLDDTREEEGNKEAVA